MKDETTNRWPFAYLGHYHFDVQSGLHWAEDMVDGEGNKTDLARVRLNYVGSPSEFGFYEGKLIAVSRSPSNSFFTVNDVKRYPQRRHQYFQIRRWDEFKEAQEFHALADYIHVRFVQKEAQLTLTPQFRFRSDTVLISVPDETGVLYAGFHYDWTVQRYVSERIEDELIEQQIEDDHQTEIERENWRLSGYGISYGTFSWEDVKNKDKTPFFFLGKIKRAGNLIEPLPFQYGGETFYFCMPNGRLGLPLTEFFRDNERWQRLDNHLGLVALFDSSTDSSKPMGVRDSGGGLAIGLNDRISQKPLSGFLEKGWKGLWVDVANLMAASTSKNFLVGRVDETNEFFVGSRDGGFQDVAYWKPPFKESLDKAGSRKWCQGQAKCFKREGDTAWFLSDVVLANHIEPRAIGDRSPLKVPDGEKPQDGLLAIGCWGDDKTISWVKIPHGVYAVRDPGDFDELKNLPLTSSAMAGASDPRRQNGPFDGASAFEVSKVAAYLELGKVSHLTPSRHDGWVHTDHILLQCRGGLLLAGFDFDSATQSYKVNLDSLKASRISIEQMWAVWDHLGYVMKGDHAHCAVFASVFEDFDIVNEFLWVGVNESKRSKKKAGEGFTNWWKEEEVSFVKQVGMAAKLVRLSYDERILACFHTVIKLKHYGVFPILAGPPGSGKSSLVQLYGRVVTKEERRVKPIYVGSSWNRPDDLIGWINPLDKRFHPSGNGFYELVQDANKDPKQYYFACLEEMNLAPVEAYFSDFIQLLSTSADQRFIPGVPRDQDSPDSKEERDSQCLKFSDNLILIGTKNDDATACTFSERFIDRCATIFIDVAPESAEKNFGLGEVGVDWGRLKEHGDIPCAFDEKWLTHVEGTDDHMKELDSRHFQQWDDPIVLEDKRCLHSVDEVFGEVLRLLKENETGIRPSHRVNVSIKAYLVNRPPVSENERSGSWKDFQLRVLDEAVAIFLLPHRFHGTGKLAEVKKAFDNLFGEMSFCANFIARRQAVENERLAALGY